MVTDGDGGERPKPAVAFCQRAMGTLYREYSHLGPVSSMGRRWALSEAFVGHGRWGLFSTEPGRNFQCAPCSSKTTEWACCILADFLLPAVSPGRFLFPFLLCFLFPFSPCFSKTRERARSVLAGFLLRAATSVPFLLCFLFPLFSPP